MPDECASQLQLIRAAAACGQHGSQQLQATHSMPHSSLALRCSLSACHLSASQLLQPMLPERTFHSLMVLSFVDRTMRAEEAWLSHRSRLIFSSISSDLR